MTNLTPDLTDKRQAAALLEKSKVGNTKDDCGGARDDGERLYFVLTETAVKWRYKERRDRRKQEESESRDLRTAYYLHVASLH